MNRHRSAIVVAGFAAFGVLAGCSSESAPDAAPADSSEVRAGVKEIKGVRLGTYASRKPKYAEAGNLTEVTFEAPTAKTAKKFDGTYSGKVKTANGTREVKGGFAVVKKELFDEDAQKKPRNVVQFFEGDKVSFELVFFYYDNTLVFFYPPDVLEFYLEPVKYADGTVPFRLDCSLTDLIDDNVFEEGLSMEEYPDISIEEVDGKMEVFIGAAMFDGSDGEKIVVNSRSGSDVDLSIEMGHSMAYRVKVEKKKGVVQTVVDGATSDVAEFACE